MRNLFRIFIKYHLIIIFLFLETISLLLLIQNNYNQRASFINSSNNISGTIFNTYSSVTQYMALKEVNKRLADENAFYRNMLNNSFIYYNDSFKNPDSLKKQHYKYITAQVINNSVNKQNNFMTLDKGAKHGIKPDMGVVGSDGVVGVVKNVSDNFSTVISVLNSNLKISTKIKRNGFYGSLYWDGWDEKYAKLSDIPIHVPIHRGDTLVTSGFSTIFPEGIIVGYIISFRQDKGSNFYDIDVRLASEIRSLEYVYVIDNILRNEQIELETESEIEND